MLRRHLPERRKQLLDRPVERLLNVRMDRPRRHPHEEEEPEHAEEMLDVPARAEVGQIHALHAIRGVR
eukprot:7388164-Prymnesium_polylepis.3